jgi:hypothetical protein
MPNIFSLFGLSPIIWLPIMHHFSPLLILAKILVIHGQLNPVG